jgi:hypothetical protein
VIEARGSIAVASPETEITSILASIHLTRNPTTHEGIVLGVVVNLAPAGAHRPSAFPPFLVLVL